GSFDVTPPRNCFRHAVLSTHHYGDMAAAGKERRQQVLLVAMGMQDVDVSTSHKLRRLCERRAKSIPSLGNHLHRIPPGAEFFLEPAFIQEDGAGLDPGITAQGTQQRS